jgi:hypothetical protein
VQALRQAREGRTGTRSEADDRPEAATGRLAETLMDSALKGALGATGRGIMKDKGDPAAAGGGNHSHAQGDLPAVEQDRGGGRREVPAGRSCKPGSLLGIALAHDIHLEHNCGGSCACDVP